VLLSHASSHLVDARLAKAKQACADLGTRSGHAYYS
jgi:hypothetical protein